MARRRPTIYRDGYGKPVLADWLCGLASIKLMTFSVAFSTSSETAQYLRSKSSHMTTKDILTNLSTGDPGSQDASTKSNDNAGTCRCTISIRSGTSDVGEFVLVGKD